MRPGAVPGPEDGFTLVETLVAFTVLVLVLIGAYAGVSTSLRADRRAEFLRNATVLARSKLDELGLSGSIQVGATSGTSRGLAWTMVITADAASNGGAGLGGYWATITVSDDLPRPADRFAMTTLKLGSR